MVGAGVEGPPRHRLRQKTRVQDVSPHSLDPEPVLPDDNPCVEDFPAVRHRRPDPEPSNQQRFEHSLTHLPYKSWCQVCVGARGRSDPHR